MTDIQRVLFELLTEIDKMCRRNNIKYYLHDNVALFARRSKRYTDRFCHANVAMDVENFKKFIDIFEKEKPEGRSLESWLTNENYGEFGARYVNENTLFLDLPNCHTYNHYGFGVRINVIRDVPASKFKSKLLTAKEIGWEMTFKQGNPSKSKKAKLCGLWVDLQLKYTDKAVFAQKMFEQFCQSYCSPSAKDCFIKNFRTRRHHFSKESFGEPRTCILENYEFFEPEPVSYYISYFGENWETKKPTGRQLTNWVIADTEIPYHDYLNELDKTDCTLEDYLEQRDIFVEMQKSGQDKVDTIHHYWDLLFRTGDRYDLWEEYMPIKSEIMALHKQGRYDELTHILQHYRTLLNKNYKLGLGLCFDPDILDIMLDIFCYEGKEEYAQKVRDMVPPEHLQPIVIKSFNDN